MSLLLIIAWDSTRMSGSLDSRIKSSARLVGRGERVRQTARMVVVSKLLIAHWRAIRACGFVIFLCATSVCAESSSSQASGGSFSLKAGARSTIVSVCENQTKALVEDLDRVLASDPAAINPVYETFHRHFPIQNCNIADVLKVARSSRFFVGSEEWGTYYNILFNSAGVSPRPGFAVQISVAKGTGNLELPFAKVNGYLRAVGGEQ